MKLAIYIFSAAAFLMFLILGFKLRRGKWLSLLAGNTMVDRDKLNTEGQFRNARLVGSACYAASFLVFSICELGYLNDYKESFVPLGVGLFVVALLNLLAFVVRVLLMSERQK
jgi:hypothetical protein